MSQQNRNNFQTWVLLGYFLGRHGLHACWKTPRKQQFSQATTSQGNSLGHCGFQICRTSRCFYVAEFRRCIFAGKCNILQADTSPVISLGWCGFSNLQVSSVFAKRSSTDPQWNFLGDPFFSNLLYRLLDFPSEIQCRDLSRIVVESFRFGSFLVVHRPCNHVSLAFFSCHSWLIAMFQCSFACMLAGKRSTEPPKSLPWEGLASKPSYSFEIHFMFCPCFTANFKTQIPRGTCLGWPIFLHVVV